MNKTKPGIKTIGHTISERKMMRRWEDVQHARLMREDQDRKKKMERLSADKDGIGLRYLLLFIAVVLAFGPAVWWLSALIGALIGMVR